MFFVICVNLDSFIDVVKKNGLSFGSSMTLHSKGSREATKGVGVRPPTLRHCDPFSLKKQNGKLWEIEFPIFVAFSSVFSLEVEHKYRTTAVENSVENTWEFLFVGG